MLSLREQLVVDIVAKLLAVPDDVRFDVLQQISMMHQLYFDEVSNLRERKLLPLPEVDVE